MIGYKPFDSNSAKAIINYLTAVGYKNIHQYVGDASDGGSVFVYYQIYYIEKNTIKCTLHNIFNDMFPDAEVKIIHDVDLSRNLNVVLEEARQWYLGTDPKLKELALRVYSEEELLPSIEVIMGKESYPINSSKNKALRALEMCAKYFNKDWVKSCGSTGYFIGMGVRGDKTLGIEGIGIGQHDSVVYPGLTYFKNKKDVYLAAKILGAEKILALFS